MNNELQKDLNRFNLYKEAASVYISVLESRGEVQEASKKKLELQLKELKFMRGFSWT